MTTLSERSEWLEADGLGGFASGTVAGPRTRRYQALLLPATTPPTGRVVLVNGFDAWIETPAGRFALSTQRYAPDVLHPDGHRHIESFDREPWPTWTFKFDDGTRVTQEIFVAREPARTVVIWRLADARPGVRLEVRPFLSGRDYHSMHHENGAFRFDADVRDGRIVWRPYDGLSGVASLANATYEHRPDWYRNFLYAVEQERGLDTTEDLATPGVLTWKLSDGDAVWVLSRDSDAPASATRDEAAALGRELRTVEGRRRRAFPTPLHRAADAYIVRRGAGKTVVAGYPWFTDWGRDTFIAIRGLCIAPGRLAEARDILVQWASAVSQGMLPNRFPDAGDEPEYNSVDASLWYIVAVHDLLAAAEGRRVVSKADRETLARAVDQILEGFSAGTRHGIRMDADGLLAAGTPGVQLTWMDAKIGDWVVTPRIGKPVEIEALWINALWIGSRFANRWAEPLARAQAAFANRFWHEAGQHLYDVVDDNHQPGRDDATFRPNQIMAVGGLPLALVTGDRARAIVDQVERKLWTPVGLRSLAPGSPGYTARYAGGPVERDSVYHQGTVWAWLMGPFVEAWIATRGGTADARREARARFVEPLRAHLDEAGLGHVSEIADAEAPHTPRGCPFQAWSVGELLRLEVALAAD